MNPQKINKQLIVVCGVIVKDNKILMTLRTEPEMPDAHMKWEFPGGKIDEGETPEQALLREIKEETGIKASVIKLLPYVQTSYWHYEWGTQQTICLLYLCKFLKQGNNPHDHHVAKIKWQKIDEIKKLDSLPGTKEVIEVVKKELMI